MDNGPDRKYDALVCGFSIAAQIATLVSLCNSKDDYAILWWYIPTYLVSVLVVIPFVNTHSRTYHERFFRVLYAVSLVGQFVVTVLFYTKSWCGVAPAVCAICPAVALDVSKCRLRRGLANPTPRKPKALRGE